MILRFPNSQATQDTNDRLTLSGWLLDIAKPVLSYDIDTTIVNTLEALINHVNEYDNQAPDIKFLYNPRPVLSALIVVNSLCLKQG